MMLSDQFVLVDRESDPHRRGRLFEPLVARMFRCAHFRVDRNPRTARPRQTDLVARDEKHTYLVEAKWQQRPAGSAVVDGIRSRLARTEPGTVGVIVSMAGFAATARDEVEANRAQPILLLNYGDIARVASGRVPLREVLNDKHDALRIEGVAVITEADPTDDIDAMLGRSPPKIDRFIDGVGNDLSYFTAGGDFSSFVFVPELPDVDWVPVEGHGVTIDLPSSFDRVDAIEVLERLTDAGWLAGSMYWNLQQATTNWHGYGATSLEVALRKWEDRYQSVDAVHHTEQLALCAPCEEGLLVLSVDIAAKERFVYTVRGAVQLPGMPVDPTPIRRLASLLDVRHPVYARPLSRPAIERRRPPREAPVGLEPVGLILHDDGAGKLWVTGLVVRNPVLHMTREDLPAWCPPAIQDSEVCVCDLRHHHPVDHPMPDYHLWRTEWTWVGEVLAVRVIADWDPEPGPCGPDEAPKPRPAPTSDPYAK